MRLIMNVLIILPYYLAFVHGLVIPRDELGGLGISSCNGLDTCEFRFTISLNLSRGHLVLAEFNSMEINC